MLLDARLDTLVAYVSPGSLVGGAEAGDFTEAVQFGQLATLAGAAGALPAYMVPSAVVGVEEWPRTSSAKIDSKRLPPPSLAGTPRAEVVVPRSY